MTRAAREVLLVDGSNVARSTAWIEAIEREVAELPHDLRGVRPDPRSRLLDWILAWTTHSGCDVVVVFDGEGPLGAGRVQWGHGYLVVGSGATDGDTVVEQESARLVREGARVRLVTDDRALANVAGADAQVVLGVDHFVAELQAEHEPPPTGLVAEVVDDVNQGFAGTRLVDTVDDPVRERLERMRRGLDDA
jgi:predicted RNA-binding protein with PIN domain